MRHASLLRHMRRQSTNEQLLRGIKAARRGASTRYRDQDAMASAVALLAASCILAVVVLAEERKYTTKYDNVDIDSVIQNERLLKNYVGCLLDKNPCTPDAAELKTNLPDALSNDCSLCSDTQKRIADKLAHHLIDHRPEDWTLLEERYDPTGDYRERYLHSREEPEEERQSNNNNNNSESKSKEE